MVKLKAQIHYLPNERINEQKWNNCIAQSINANVYAESWYLNIVNENWAALVMGDYDIVMPLTLKRKLTIPYLYTPLYTQQLGVFSKIIVNEDIVNSFLSSALTYFPYIDIKLNYFNKTTLKKIEQIPLHNQVLDLIQTYPVLYKKYSNSNRKNIKKAEKNNVKIIQGISLHSFLNLKEQTAEEQNEPFDIQLLRKLISASLYRKRGELIGAYDQNNGLCAALFLVHDAKKTYLISSAANAIGKQNSAAFLLIDNIIQKYAEKNRMLDFEGSMIPGVAARNNGFGAKTITYTRIKCNKLPWPLKMLKK